MVCSGEERNETPIFMVKWFSQDRQEDWEREVCMHLKMSQKGGHPCVLPYVWHSKGENTWSDLDKQKTNNSTI